ncbi:DUF427 domain-containing protein [Halomonas titanicae]|uniref:DUF427 domain-containing protein n=1 Tax=Vreelandella titanicae TaxID=664683 RepID=UPI001F204094|nr:DUF427 domain-containing protein [Halomonas titanicae]MCE7518228.1 DUF427 domain-containing protein [Halomonas titanicae]
MPQAPHIERHPVSQRVQVHVDGMQLTDSIQAIELREIGYPPRPYFPRQDVRMDLLTSSETMTYCPYKSNKVYFSLRDYEDIV